MFHTLIMAMLNQRAILSLDGQCQPFVCGKYPVFHDIIQSGSAVQSNGASEFLTSSIR